MDQNEAKRLAARAALDLLPSEGIIGLGSGSTAKLFIDAVALERNGLPPKEKKLGAFHLAGLKGLQLAERHFVPEPVFDPAAAKYEGVTLFVVGAA